MNLTLTLMPAGTAGDKVRDRSILDEIADKTGCRSWAIQATMNKTKPPRDYLRFILGGMARSEVVKQATRRTEMLTRYGEVRCCLDYERVLESEPDQYDAAVCAVASDLRAAGMPATTLYGLSLARMPQPGRLARLVSAGRFTSTGPSLYIRNAADELRPATDELVAADRIGPGVDCRPYLCGCYSQTGTPITVPLLRIQLNRLADQGVRHAFVWFNLGWVAAAVTGVARIWEASRPAQPAAS